MSSTEQRSARDSLGQVRMSWSRYSVLKIVLKNEVQGWKSFCSVCCVSYQPLIIKILIKLNLSIDPSNLTKYVITEVNCFCVFFINFPNRDFSFLAGRIHYKVTFTIKSNIFLWKVFIPQFCPLLWLWGKNSICSLIYRSKFTGLW